MPVPESVVLQSHLNDLRVTRPVVEVAPRVVTLTGTGTELQPPGSVSILVANRGSGVLDELQAASEAKDNERLQGLLDPVKDQMLSMEPLSLSDLSEVIDGRPSFLDVSYGGRVVVPALFTVDAAPLTRVLLPYVGGGLSENSFTVAEYADSGVSELDVLVIVHEPEVDPEVADLLARLPVENDTIRIGDANMFVPTTTVTPVIVAILVATVATAVVHCNPHFESEEWVVRADERLSNLAPTLAVQQLLARREQLLAQPAR